MPQYTVQGGDTLWSIAEKLLGDGNRYPEIQGASNLANTVIYPGQVLNIPGDNHGNSDGGIGSISEDEFDRAITSNGFASQRHKYNDFKQSCNYGNIGTKSEAAMYLATLLHESDGLRATKEYYNPASKAAYGRYIGRGYVQLSSETNYRAASNYLGVDYVNNPEQVEHDPHAWNVSAWYWKDQVHQHANDGFQAIVTRGIRPLEPHFERRKAIYRNVCQAFNVNQHL